MKLERSVYVIVTAAVVCSLLVASLAAWQDSGIGAGASNWRKVVCLITYTTGTVGVIWLGWYWLRVAGTVASTVRTLERAESDPIDSQPPALTDSLNRVVDDHVKACSDEAEKLRAQIEDLQLQIRLAQRQKRNTEAIIYSLRDAVIVADEFDRMLMANEAAGALFRFDFQRSQHKPVGELVESGKSEFVDYLRQCRRSKTEASKRELHFTDAEKPRVFDCIVSCVKGPDQQICGVVAILHEITREKEVSQMKNDFVSHVSHELKTPLASITAYTEMLVDGEADDEEMRKQFYTVIQNQAQRLNRLIEEILNISRIESGLIKVDKKPVSLTIVIQEQLQMIKSYANEKNIELIAQKPIVYDQVYADKDMVSQVIVNLLSNAVKYTPSGGSVKIETVVDENAGIARVTVTDTGVGIPPDEVKHVFDKFYRVRANEKKAKGTGLGLNLVKQIIEKVHGGRVFVTSEPGVGSTFGFELPLATQQAVGV